jgi:NADPH-dependent glutamate synthase beta subunit-like oxidoreductase/coenzyme F420-reducing hydrogenase delta subunit
MNESISDSSSYAPCTVSCPVHTDTRLLVELIAKGDYDQALELLLDANPFSSVCGRICHHPCEQGCRRSKVDAPVGLMKLKRFVMEVAKDYRIKRREQQRPSMKKNEAIGIVGSGPSGLTAAHDLAKMGYQVVVFERSETPGGMLGTTIPRYRLPYSVLWEDIEDVISLGVEVKTNFEIGKNCTIEDLFKEGYNAVLLASGLSESRTLNIPGIDSAGIILALPFLRTVLSSNPPILGKRVVVIGGGNVAIDAARSARRLGAEKVTMVCLESRDQMPAWEWEIRETEEEGIKIMNSWGPKAVYSEDKRVKGLELKKCVRIFDSDNRFNPQFDESDIATVSADNVIIAIGQRGDLTCIQGSGIPVLSGEKLECNPLTLSTTRKGLFVCGELLTGPASSVEAVRDGHRAARAIDHYLRTGDLFEQPTIDLPALGELPDETIEKIQKRYPIMPASTKPDERVKNFLEIEQGFSEGEALSEAKRCMACTTGALADEKKCAACLTCVRVCPFGVATIEKTAFMPEEKCQACGLCAAQCPAAAIALKRFGTNQMKEHLSDLLSSLKSSTRAKPLIVSYNCLFEVTSREFMKNKSKEYRRFGIYTIMVPCVARLSVHDILSPFELGVEGVNIIACSDGTCLYPSAELRLLDRVSQAKGILLEIGLEAERIDFWKTKSSAEVSWTSFWEISRRKLIQINKKSNLRKDNYDSSRKKAALRS